MYPFRAPYEPQPCEQRTFSSGTVLRKSSEERTLGTKSMLLHLCVEQSLSSTLGLLAIAVCSQEYWEENDGTATFRHYRSDLFGNWFWHLGDEYDDVWQNRCTGSEPRGWPGHRPRHYPV